MQKHYKCMLFFVCLIFLCGQPIYAHTLDTNIKNPYSLYDKTTLKYPKLVITDVNDTLIKSWWPTYELVTRCLVRLGHERMSLEEINASPLIHIVDLLWSKTGKDLAVIEKIYKEELEILSKNSSPPIPIRGAVDLLKYLKGKHIPVVVISNDDKKILSKNLDKLGWNNYFLTVVTKNEAPDGINKPDPKIVSYAIKKAGLNEKDYDSSSIWFVGDSYGDVKCAASANVVPIWAEDKATARFTHTDDGIKIVVAKNPHEIIELMRGLEPDLTDKDKKTSNK
jgi:phosphoglycolate phosphatase-like HAD superfamily hydrolase